MNLTTDTQNRLVELDKGRKQFTRIGSNILTNLFRIIAGAEDPQALLDALGDNAVSLFQEFGQAQATMKALGGNAPDIVVDNYTFNGDGTVTYNEPVEVESEPEPEII
jgi:hypothetical protein